tara:strand:- start:31 stop:288 length:258 start_codon:yes stop_codon:yes gene_type:complete
MHTNWPTAKNEKLTRSNTDVLYAYLIRFKESQPAETHSKKKSFNLLSMINGMFREAVILRVFSQPINCSIQWNPQELLAGKQQRD